MFRLDVLQVSGRRYHGENQLALRIARTASEMRLIDKGFEVRLNEDATFNQVMRYEWR